VYEVLISVAKIQIQHYCDTPLDVWLACPLQPVSSPYLEKGVKEIIADVQTVALGYVVSEFIGWLRGRF